MEAGLTAILVKYGGIAALVILLAERLARLTPNETDDVVVNWIRKVLKALGVDFPNIVKAEKDKVVVSTPTESEK